MTFDFRRAPAEEHDAAFLAIVDAVQDDGEHARRALANPAHDLFLAFEEDVLVGGALCTEMLVKGQRRAVVETLVVSPLCLGRGIGRRLMQLAELHFRGRGVEAMQVTVRADNAPARALYDSLGYISVERRVRMVKELVQDGRSEETAASIEVIVRWTEDVWNSGRLACVPDLVAEDCLRHDPGREPRTITVAENLQRIASFRQQVPDLHFTNDDLFADGDRVVARFSMTGTDPDTREQFAFSGMEIFRVQAGKIVETWSSETAQGPWPDSLAR